MSDDLADAADLADPQLHEALAASDEPEDVADPLALAAEDFWPAPVAPPSGRCAWPFGKPGEFRCCGERRSAGRPYCQVHESASRVRHVPKVRLAEPRARPREVPRPAPAAPAAVLERRLAELEERLALETAARVTAEAAAAGATKCMVQGTSCALASARFQGSGSV